MSAILKDYSNIVMKRVDNSCRESVQEVAEILAEAVREKMIYGYSDPHGKDGHTEIWDTGALFSSVEASSRRVSQNTYEAKVEVGKGLDYAEYVHNGTYKLKGRPFFSDAIAENKEAVENQFKSKFKDALM